MPSLPSASVVLSTKGLGVRCRCWKPEPADRGLLLLDKEEAQTAVEAVLARTYRTTRRNRGVRAIMVLGVRSMGFLPGRKRHQNLVGM